MRRGPAQLEGANPLLCCGPVNSRLCHQMGQWTSNQCVQPPAITEQVTQEGTRWEVAHGVPLPQPGKLRSKTLGKGRCRHSWSDFGGKLRHLLSRVKAIKKV